ncbi:MAG TPA: thiamine pyrophosphate-dependent enzyme, partial [Anaerolineaceae bacterium]|nr:thiamine pyrophosphate-dependent enzyme [Anaerolineaceae bacterium]
GAHLPIAAGLALGDLYQKNEAATICLFGDGATNIGYFHEAVNLSKVWKLPVLWVCENNQYGMGTTLERASAVTDIRRKANGYDIPNFEVDGMDVMKVREIALKLLSEIRAGSGPQFLEIHTYRFRGHSMGDPERYRKSEEVKKWQENDPIGIYRKYLVENKLASEHDLDGQDQLCEDIVRDAVEFAESSPEPAPEELYANIYVDN